MEEVRRVSRIVKMGFNSLWVVCKIEFTHNKTDSNAF